MRGYLVMIKNKVAVAKECRVVNFLIGVEEIAKMEKNESFIVECEGVKRAITKRRFYLTLSVAGRMAKEYNIKQKIKKERKLECFWCEKKLNVDNATIDHITPKCKYKDWEMAWRESNLTISCYDCNHTKSNLDPKLNLHIQRKAELIKYRRAKLSSKNRKICRSINPYADNVQQISKRDSSFYNVKAFFMKQKFTRLV